MILKFDRKLNRMPGFDYSQPGYYFVTICTKDRIEYFGDVKDEEMILNNYGRVVQKQWLWLQKQYQYVKLDKYIIMPNHLHGIIFFDYLNNVGTRRALSLQEIKIKSLSEIIGAFKTTSSKMIHKMELYEFQWQRSFYDHVIRDEDDLARIRQYILDNPLKWHLDRNYSANLK